ncbi:NifX-associated nitrogen fixation protein [Calothrix sp. UHCC 0171]|uniref:NifX-associated nitrogen fixation protein n=1 Tax=Calothrix sp. UHCC 0171 TaxID=3110245 RepID=UPI002B21F9CE|nr:NifX-associated nitrogen fixation protein [Calothrix sp. UHCC 0171]MEA5574288.1 NifX-associated nitrogen fixation protein [Calothrix sp. UHCC 0171]
MSDTNSVKPSSGFDVEKSAFLKAITQQIRAQDIYGVYRSWTDELLLKPYIVSKQKKREIPIDGDVDPMTISRINAFYRAAAACIEKETGLLSQVVVDLNHEGFGWILVFAGHLLLIRKTIRDAHRYGFESLEKVAEEGDKLVAQAVDLTKRFPEVGKL